MDFTHYTDPPVELAAELVNTLSPVSGNDTLATVEQLQRFLDDHDGEWAIGERDLEEVRRLRGRLRRVFEAPDAATAAALINEILEEAGAIPRVSVHQGSAPHLHFEPLRASPARRLAAAAAMGLAVVLCEDGKERLGVCGASRCRDVFVDTSRNRSRRYCGDVCTTRQSVAAYRRRRRAEG